MSRISYRNYPILEIIKKGKLESFPYYQEDLKSLKERNKDIKFIFESMSDLFSNNIIKVSSNFLDNSLNSREKLNKLILEDCENVDLQFNGTLILNKFLYSYSISVTKGALSNCVFEFFPNGGIRNVVLNDKIVFASLVDNDSALKLNSAEGDNYGYFLTLIIMSILYFKKYASVEVIESKAKSKTNQFGCKYLNETDLDIEYLDSKWFTTLVNSNGFKVRGFFRLQPKKKDGEWTKELIWIDEFEKKGYNRQAKILSH